MLNNPGNGNTFVSERYGFSNLINIGGLTNVPSNSNTNTFVGHEASASNFLGDENIFIGEAS